MIVTINVNISTPVATTHNVYSGLTASGTTDLVCSNVTSFCSFNVDDSYVSSTHIYVRVSCERCHDQIYKIKIEGTPS